MLPDPANQVDAVSALAQNAAQLEAAQPSPGDVGPSVDAYGSDPQTLVTLPMTPADMAAWWEEIERARERVKAREAKWDMLLKEYLPIVEASGTPEDVKVNGHFRDVHTKIGQLFYRNPELFLTPKGVTLDQVPSVDPTTGMPVVLTAEEIVSVKQAVLNDKLGRDEINASRLMDELLFDTLAWSGIGASKLGYRVVTQSVQQQVPVRDAATQQPVIDPLTQQPQMQTQNVPVPIFEEWYWRRFSPKKLLFNADLRSTRYDKDATWMGMEFFLSPKAAQKAFGLTEQETQKAAEDDRVHQYDDDTTGSKKRVGLVRGVELVCKACHYTDQRHPLAMNQLIVIEGIKDRPVVWRPSPDQTFDQQGKLTQDSLIGFPFQVLTIRDLADSPFPPADAAFTNSQIKQESTFMRQSVALRDAAIGKQLVDGSHFEDEELALLTDGAAGTKIKVREGALAGGPEKLVANTAQVHATPDDWRTQAMLRQDRNETLGISANTSGTETDTVRSATESAIVQTAIASRNEKEQARATDFYLDGARKIDTLLMRYATMDDYVQITGQDGASKIMKWNGTIIAGRWMYDIAPDSQMRIDTARDREQMLRFHNIAVMDPLYNRAYGLRRLARMFGLDPDKTVLNPVAMMQQVPHSGMQEGGTANKHQVGISGGMENAPNAGDHRGLVQ